MAGIKLLLDNFKDKESDEKIDSKKNGPIMLSKKQKDVADYILSNISCDVDKKTNVISITVTDQDPLVAATIADSVQRHLQVAITEYKTKKAKIDVAYMEDLYEEAKRDYDKARKAYAEYADANMDIELQIYKSKETDLENEMQLKYNIYQQVVEQLQLSKAKVQERTPAFIVMQSAAVPVKHSDRPKVFILAIWMIVGFMLRSGMLMWKNKEKFINLQNA
jgi:uncharacterized protein involved in exopolysaccharide biosynthesis